MADGDGCKERGAPIQASQRADNVRCTASLALPLLPSFERRPAEKKRANNRRIRKELLHACAAQTRPQGLATYPAGLRGGRERPCSLSRRGWLACAGWEGAPLTWLAVLAVGFLFAPHLNLRFACFFSPPAKKGLVSHQPTRSSPCSHVCLPVCLRPSLSSLFGAGVREFVIVNACVCACA